MHRTLASIRPRYYFEPTCAGTVPESIICFLEANSYEDTVRNAVSLGGEYTLYASFRRSHRDRPMKPLNAYEGSVQSGGHPAGPRRWATHEQHYLSLPPHPPCTHPGNGDTLAAISGAIAEAFYGGVPRQILEQGLKILKSTPQAKRLLDVLRRFNEAVEQAAERGTAVCAAAPLPTIATAASTATTAVGGASRAVAAATGGCADPLKGGADRGPAPVSLGAEGG